MLKQFRHDTTGSTRLAALDTLRANVMIADHDLTIRYMNPALKTFLGAAQADLRKDLPNFNVDTLIGSNIDIFHKDPSHQRRILGTLSTVHDATIWVGNRAFDLRVVPLRRKDRTDGFVVEWADASARLNNLDYAAQIAAIGRCQAVIELAADGTIMQANDNFLKLMGYRLDEIVGRNHSMFVEPGFEKSQIYSDFWRALRRGEYQATQFKRVAKGGRPVWIEGAYTPVLDAQGKVGKIIKFATDISHQMTLLADLKRLIDENFGEIDNAIDLSSNEARAAAAAAQETSGNVQSVAASAEQLAASVQEISQSMARSRTATEAAFDQTVSVGKNTDSLANAAQSMNGVVGLIRDIAGQINLLALNATIEAARAGDAGKGFAVVASEVKSLAIQAARATEQITAEIERVQSTSLDVAGALGAIRDAVNAVREHVASTASAVEEQTAVTQSMSQNMQNASGAVSTVSTSVTEISTAVSHVAQAVAKTKEAAKVLAR